MNNNELLPCPFKRGQVWEDSCGGLIMIVAVSPRGEDYEVEYVHEDGYIGSAYASKFHDRKKYSDPVQEQNYNLTKCPKCGGEADNAVPEGWRLVPIEPTGPMIMAGIHAHERNDDLPHLGTGPKSVGVYKSMISAAPMPQQGKVGPEKATTQPDLTKCPKCGGIADNGIDRCHPPHPYNCKKCHGEGPYTEAQKVGSDG